jgi:hypothetical protein
MQPAGIVILVRLQKFSVSATVMQKQGDCVDTWSGSASHFNYKLLLRRET